jgi:hypothetical protein
MDKEHLAALEEELLRYVAEIYDGKHLETNSLEIRTKLDALNTVIDQLTEEQGASEELTTITFIAYQYYRLLYT